ncbi:MAG: DEAD/DEAH box helicase [Acidimicrobiales bacterium]
MALDDSPDPLSLFAEPVAAWFRSSFTAPTPPQAQGWPAIAGGEHTLILAPTGSGKTLTAFLWGLNQLMTTEPPPAKARTRIVYVSPLRALAVDVDKNLRAPLNGIALASERLGTALHHVPQVGVRTGDTPADVRHTLVRQPPDILITTPESLYLMLTSQARETLVNVESVIIDEIHALAATKRGAHLALTLERLARVTARPPQRIGLSATQRPLDEIARFLGGFDTTAGADRPTPRPVRIVDAGVRKPLELEVVVPVEDLSQLGELLEEPASGPLAAGPVRRSIWPSIHPRLLELVKQHRSTIIFVNARRLAERLASRLNELEAEQLTFSAGESMGTSVADPAHELVKAHHGSLSRERRLLIEDELKSGRLKGLVATSSLELGIDMGAVDLVIQVESPGAVSAGLQRIGRAGHQVGEPSRGKLFPKHRADLIEAAVVTQRMRDGQIEATRYPRNPLDVLCQQIVAMVALDDLPLDTIARTVRGAANFAELSDEQLRNVVDLLSGRYPSEEFSELRPRVVWDRLADVVKARPGAQRLAVTNPGTIPDRGLYGVFLPDGTRVGELDEEMVYESRPGETFLLGASTWRIEDITFDRVIVTPAPGQPGKMPFWHGDGPGRPLELGLAIGEFTRRIRAMDEADALALLQRDHALDPWAASNALQYLRDQADATGVVPDDRTIVVERFRDEIGDWRVCILCPFGAQVLAPWGMALRNRLAEHWGYDPEMMWSDDGIVIRLPEATDDLPTELLRIEPEDIDEAVVAALPQTAMFAARFREAAGRALLLPRRRPDQRTPLWQQRQRAADLLAVAARYPAFPLLLETTRECLNDVFDLPALRQVLTDLRSRRIRMVSVDTPKASPFAASLLFGWIAVYMYEGDAPLAERRAAALALDRDLLRDLLGAEELRELLDPQALADLEVDLQLLGERRRARHAEDLWDALRLLGPLTRPELDARSETDPAPWIEALLAEHRIIEVTIAGQAHLADAADAGRLRDALGCAIPIGLPAAFTESVAEPLVELVARFARTHGPFLVTQLGRRFGITPERARPALDALAQQGRVVHGEFRPGGSEREWCDADVLRQLRRRSLAALRREIEPVPQAAYARFLPVWQGVGGGARGVDALADALAVLAGAAIPASVLEADVLATRLARYRPADLDALCTAGELVWVGAGAIGSNDGRVRLVFRDQAALLLGAEAAVAGGGPGGSTPEGAGSPDDPLHHALLAELSTRGASFWGELVAAAQRSGQPHDDASVLAALWDLVWAGLVTNDSLAPVRALVGRAGTRTTTRHDRQRGRSRPRLGRLTRTGPPAAAGRWSLVAPLLQPPPSPTEAVTARALQLLERYGVLTREAALGEGAHGGFAGVYPVLKALEERGQVRRGYFVEGLGAAQFAVPGAVDRLRAHRETDPDDARDDGVLVLAATDPAQPFGAALPWPDSRGRPARAAGAHVLLAGGEALAYLERSGRSLLTFPAATDDDRWTTALQQLLDRGRYRQIELTRIDGDPAGESPLAPLLRTAGFRDGYRGLVLRQ